MIFYFGRTYTETRTGSKLAITHCEQCRLEYGYLLTRCSTGSGTAPYGLGANAAAERAAKQAKKRVDASLKKETDLVPCPQCGWIQSDMIRHARKIRLRGWLWVSSALAGVMLICGLVLAILWRDARQLHPVWIIGFSLSGIGALACLAYRWHQNQHWDPNTGHNGEPRPQKASPPPMVKQKDMRGDIIWEEVHQVLPLAEKKAVTVLWHCFRPPQACCLCQTTIQPLHPLLANHFMQASDRRKFYEGKFFACSACRRKWWWRNIFRTTMFGLIGLAVGSIPGWYCVFMKGLNYDAQVILMLCGGVGFLVGLGSGSPGAMAYRVQTIDAHRLLYRLRFHSPNMVPFLLKHWETCATPPVVLNLNDPNANTTSSNSDRLA